MSVILFISITLFFVRGVAGVKKGAVLGKRDYTPVSWNQYFQRVVDVKVDADVSIWEFIV